MKANRNYAIGDLHFFHDHILKYEPRPFSTREEMVEGLIKNWNNTVHSDQDNVYIVGDFWPGKTEDTLAIMQRLRGRKHIILGNHDYQYSTNKWYSMGASSVCYQMVLPLNKNITAKLCHFPYECERYPTMLPVKEENMWLIHGHVHSKGKLVDYEKRTICVSCELTNYRPMDFDKIIALINVDDQK